MGWKREGDRVIIDMTIGQWHSLLIHLGEAAGGAAGRGEPIAPYLQLANAINEGNPNWTPYNVKEEEGKNEAQ